MTRRHTFKLCAALCAAQLFIPLQANEGFVLSAQDIQALQACSEQKKSHRVDCYEAVLTPILAAEGHSTQARTPAVSVAQVVELAPKPADSNNKAIPPPSIDHQDAKPKDIEHQDVEPPKGEIGEKYLATKQRELHKPKATSLQLIKVKKDKYRRWHFYFENGQIWRQTEAKYLPKQKDLPIEAVINEAALGSYNLTLLGSSKIMKVMRIK